VSREDEASSFRVSVGVRKEFFQSVNCFPASCWQDRFKRHYQKSVLFFDLPFDSVGIVPNNNGLRPSRIPTFSATRMGDRKRGSLFREDDFFCA
jgi:hypothetical protein